MAKSRPQQLCYYNNGRIVKMYDTGTAVVYAVVLPDHNDVPVFVGIVHFEREHKMYYAYTYDKTLCKEFSALDVAAEYLCKAYLDG